MSRKNREKKRKAAIKKAQTEKRALRNVVENNFEQQQANLESHLASVCALDAYLSIVISELWLPNIAAQTRHSFATAVLAATPSEFFARNPVDSYPAFRKFVGGIHSLLPTFPMLEDYVPEPDWGDIKTSVGDNSCRIFYGGLCERIPDFIEAFRLKLPGGIVGGTDLDASIAIQNFLISRISRPVLTASLEPGALEIPPETFWAECRAALLQCSEFAAGLSISPELVIAQGEGARHSWETFGDAAMTGELLPHVLMTIDGHSVPVSPRNLPSTVIYHWEQRDARPPNQVERRTAAATAQFLAERIPHHESFAGPFRISLREPGRPHVEVAGILQAESTLWLIVAIDPRRLSEMPSIERRLSALFAEDDGVVAQETSTGEILHFRTRDGAAARGMTRIMLLIAEGSTGRTAMRLFPSPSKKLFLPDFVSVMDSIRSVAELNAYFDFVEAHRMQTQSMLTGPVDLLAAFKQSHAMLVDGAFEPTFISLDPHWGSNWRYQQLQQFWAAAPSMFPDESPSSWDIRSSTGGAWQLVSRPSRKLVWATDLRNETTLHFLLDVDLQELDVEDGRLLELFINCAADSIAQRSELLPDAMFPWKRIVTTCRANEERLPSNFLPELPEDEAPLLSQWQITRETDSAIQLSVVVDLIQVAVGLKDAKEAKFEALCATEWLRGFGTLVGRPIEDRLVAAIAATANRKPRFTFQVRERSVDVPDFPQPILPSPQHFKVARRDLAIVFKELSTQPGRYELAEAKVVIDRARDAYRELIHGKIAVLSHAPLVLFGIEQFDALLAEYDRTNTQVLMSLSHEVDYDRHGRLADAHDEFLKNTKDYRYLIECVLSSVPGGDTIPTSNEIVQLVAHIDWLLVLYQASDTLHNDVDVGGIELDSSYIPDVFYSEFDDTSFKREYAEERLGQDRPGDETSGLDEAETASLDQAFLADAGFTLTCLLQVLVLLSRWRSVSPAESELRWSYAADIPEIVNTLANVISDADRTQIQAAISFLTLDPARVRVLSGRDRVEGDVPVWEHTKRDHRYTIRPLVSLRGGRLTWGAAAAGRAFSIWNGTLSDGFPPAEFAWSRVNEVSTLLKRRIEQELEVRAYDICKRHAHLVEQGIDFRSRFRMEGFDDVGDFDVLAYVPSQNLWIMVECKYNKPPFALKDARRLREQIFGKTGHLGQLAKIDRRRTFLQQNHERLRVLLGWPEAEDSQATILDLYVCPRIFYWMRRPPRPVVTEFVRLGMLDAFLSERLRSDRATYS